MSKREKHQGIPLGRTSDITMHKHADGAQDRHDSVRYRPGEMRRGGGRAVAGGDWGHQKAQLWPADGETEIRGEVTASPRLPSAFPPALCPFTFHAPLMRFSRSRRPCELKRVPLPPQECMDLPAKVQALGCSRSGRHPSPSPPALFRTKTYNEPRGQV